MARQGLSKNKELQEKKVERAPELMTGAKIEKSPTATRDERDGIPASIWGEFCQVKGKGTTKKNSPA